MAVKFSDSKNVQNIKIRRNMFTITMYESIATEMTKRRDICDLIIEEQKRKVNILKTVNEIEQKQLEEYTKERETEANNLIGELEDGDTFKHKFNSLLEAIEEVRELMVRSAREAMDLNQQVPEVGEAVNYTVSIKHNVPDVPCSAEVNALD